MREVSIEDITKAGRAGDTICWDCENSLGGGKCSWADPTRQEPVEDWVAVQTPNGYCVYACPLFKRNSYGCGMYRTADDYILDLEISNQNLKHQVDVLKRNSWWEVCNTLRKSNRKLSAVAKKLKSDLDDAEWMLTVHHGE